MESIGKLIKNELERQERSVSWFARKLSCHRTNVYNIFERDNIDVVLLVRISRILHRNFVREISDEIDVLREEQGCWKENRQPLL